MHCSFSLCLDLNNPKTSNVSISARRYEMVEELSMALLVLVNGVYRRPVARKMIVLKSTTKNLDPSEFKIKTYVPYLPPV